MKKTLGHRRDALTLTGLALAFTLGRTVPAAAQPPPVVWDISNEADLRAAAAQAVSIDIVQGFAGASINVFNLHGDIQVVGASVTMPTKSRIQSNGFTLSGPMAGNADVGIGLFESPSIQQVGAGSLNLEHVRNSNSYPPGLAADNDSAILVGTGVTYTGGAVKFAVTAAAPPPVVSDPTAWMSSQDSSVQFFSRFDGSAEAMNVFRRSTLTALGSFTNPDFSNHAWRRLYGRHQWFRRQLQ